MPIVQVVEQTCTGYSLNTSHFVMLVLCSDGHKYICKVDNTWLFGSDTPVMSSPYDFKKVI